MRWKTVLVSVLPGLGQIHSGRAGRGLAWFGLFALLLNSYFMAPFLLAGSGLRTGALVAIVTCWVLAYFDGLWCASRGGPAPTSSLVREPLPEISHERRP